MSLYQLISYYSDNKFKSKILSLYQKVFLSKKPYRTYFLKPKNEKVFLEKILFMYPCFYDDNKYIVNLDGIDYFLEIQPLYRFKLSII